MRNRDISILQQTSISKIISTKERQMAFLQTQITQITIGEQLAIPRIQQKIQKY